MQSVFVQDIRRSVMPRLTKDGNILAPYQRLSSTRNFFLSICSIAIGNLAFIAMGYHLQTLMRNSEFFISNLLWLVLAGLLFGSVVSVICALGSFAVWRVIQDNDRDTDFSGCFSVEAMSYMAYLFILPIYLVSAVLFNSYFAGMIMGAGIILKAWLMYASFPEVLQEAETSEKLLCIMGSFVAYALMCALLYWFVF